MTQRQKNNKSLLWDSLAVGAGISCMTLIALLINNYIFVWTGFTKLNDGTAFYSSIKYLLSITASMLLACFLITKLRNKKIFDIIDDDGAGAFVFFGCTMFCFLGLVLGNVVSNRLIEYVPQINNPTIYSSSGENVPELIMSLIYSAVVPALVEELFFRGVVFGMLKPYGTVFAVLGSSILFGIIHGNFVQIPFAIILGIFFSIADLAAKSIWPSIIAHFCNNAVSILLTYTADTSVYIDVQNITALVFAIWFAIGIAGVVMLTVSFMRKKNKNDIILKVSEHPELPRSSDKFLRFWLCPTIIPIYIYYFYSAMRLIL